MEFDRTECDLGLGICARDSGNSNFCFLQLILAKRGVK